MNCKQKIFSFLLLTAFAIPVFATSTTSFDKNPTKVVVEDIEKIIKKLDIDRDVLGDEIIKLKFLVNEDSELIVISTHGSQLDLTLKRALNYQKVRTKGLIPYKPYVVPLKFEST